MKRPGILPLLLTLLVVLLSSCQRLYLTEQLDAPDKRVPVIIFDYGKSFREAQRNFWKHKGNYYTMARVHYAREQHLLLDDRNSTSRRYTDTEPGVFYYFPLTNKEVDRLLDLPEGTTNQPSDAMKLPPLRVADQKREEWQQLTMKLGWNGAPESAREKHHAPGACSIEALPARKGTRGMGRALLLGPAWVIDTTANTAITIVEAPFLAVGLMLYTLAGAP